MQPIAEIAALAHRHGALRPHGCGAERRQDRGERRRARRRSAHRRGHKLNAPKGVGALFVRRGTSIRPLALGAGHERGLRPGTENVASIVGLGVACDVAATTLESKRAALARAPRSTLGGSPAGVPETRVNGHDSERLPNTLSVRFPGPRDGGARRRARGRRVDGLGVSRGSRERVGRAPRDGARLPKTRSGRCGCRSGTTTTDAEIDLAAGALVRASAARDRERLT